MAKLKNDGNTSDDTANIYKMSATSKTINRNDKNNNVSVVRTKQGKHISLPTLAKPKGATNIGKSNNNSKSHSQKSAKKTVKEMVEEAIFVLNKRSGSSYQAVLKYINTIYDIKDEKYYGRLVRRYIKKGVSEGRLDQVKLSYKLSRELKRSMTIEEKKQPFPKLSAALDISHLKPIMESKDVSMINTTSKFNSMALRGKTSTPQPKALPTKHIPEPKKNSSKSVSSTKISAAKTSSKKSIGTLIIPSKSTKKAGGKFSKDITTLSATVTEGLRKSRRRGTPL